MEEGEAEEAEEAVDAEGPRARARAVTLDSRLVVGTRTVILIRRVATPCGAGGGIQVETAYNAGGGASPLGLLPC